jgi:hypothetical protein
MQTKTQRGININNVRVMALIGAPVEESFLSEEISAKMDLLFELRTRAAPEVWSAGSRSSDSATINTLISEEIRKLQERIDKAGFIEAMKDSEDIPAQNERDQECDP